MPAPKRAGSTDTASDAQKRFVVSLPQDVGKQIDELAVTMAKAMRAQYGIGVELSRAQVVQSLVTSALDAMKDQGEES